MKNLNQPFFFHTSPVAGRPWISNRKVRATVAAVVKGDVMHFGVAKCDHQDRHKFVRSKGCELALTHANDSTRSHKVAIPDDLDRKYISGWFIKMAIKYVTGKYSVVIEK